MKKMLSAVLLFLSLAVAVRANPCPAGQKLDSYIVNFNNPAGCSVGDPFNNNLARVVAGVFAPAVLGTGVTLIPHTSEHDFDFDFQANWFESPATSVPVLRTSAISYTAYKMFNLLLEIRDPDLGLVGSPSGSNASLGGAIAIDEAFCLGGLMVSGCRGRISSSLGVFADVLGAHGSATPLNSPKVSQIDLLKAFAIDSGASGDASVSSFSNSADLMPEQVMLSLLGASLLGLGLVMMWNRGRIHLRG